MNSAINPRGAGNEKKGRGEDKSENSEGTTVWKKEQEQDAALAAFGEKTFQVGSLELEELVEIMGWQVSRLKEQARALLDTYWANHLKENEKRQLTEKSVMGCRMRLKGDSIYLEWFFNRWVKRPDGKNKPFSTYLKRGKGMSYSPSTLLRHAKDWEADLILETEEGFALVRRQNHFLSQARQNVREAMKSRDKFNDVPT
jgi:hypothetical protein